MNIGERLARPQQRAAGTSDATKKRPSREALRLRLHVSLIISDGLCLYGSFFLAHLIHFQAPSDNWLVIASGLAPLYFTTALGSRAYSTEVIVKPSLGVIRAMQALAVATAAILFVAFSFKSSENFSRLIFGLGVTGSVGSISLIRGIFLWKARTLLGGNPYNIVLITDDPPQSTHGYSTILPRSSINPREHCPDMYDKLSKSLNAADRVIVVCDAGERMAWAHLLQGANVQAEILAPELGKLAPIAVAHFGDVPTIVVARGPLNLASRIQKRGFDILVALVALFVTAPILLSVAIAIKLESRGPIFFTQMRIGRGNQIFRMFKFRSMRFENNDGRGAVSTSRDDRRVTWVGRFIRRSSIDELPQLLNVLIGNMSVVGPRPHPLGSRAEDKLFWEVDGRYWHRHAAKPGLTGLAQVRGYRGATVYEHDLINRLQSDLEYLNDWSIWKDIKILILTFRVIIHPNAY